MAKTIGEQFFEHSALAHGFRHSWSLLSKEQQARFEEGAANLAKALAPAPADATPPTMPPRDFGPVPIDPG